MHAMLVLGIRFMENSLLSHQIPHVGLFHGCYTCHTVNPMNVTKALVTIHLFLNQTTNLLALNIVLESLLHIGKYLVMLAPAVTDWDDG